MGEKDKKKRKEKKGEGRMEAERGREKEEGGRRGEERGGEGGIENNENNCFPLFNFHFSSSPPQRPGNSSQSLSTPFF